jgi:hypothetical protein
VTSTTSTSSREADWGLWWGTRGGVERWARRLCLINGVLSIMVFLSYVFYLTILGAPWAIVFPVLAVVLAVHFRQVERKEKAV